MPVSFLQKFINDSLIEVGTVSTANRHTYFESMDEQELDDQYGFLAPFVCCLDKCVHHNVNSRKRAQVFSSSFLS